MHGRETAATGRNRNGIFGRLESPKRAFSSTWCGCGRRKKAHRLQKRIATLSRIGEASSYSWHTKYGGLLPSEMKRLKQLEEENQRLKRIVIDLSPKAILLDVIRRKM